MLGRPILDYLLAELAKQGVPGLQYVIFWQAMVYRIKHRRKYSGLELSFTEVKEGVDEQVTK